MIQPRLLSELVLPAVLCVGTARSCNAITGPGPSRLIEEGLASPSIWGGLDLNL